MLFNILDSFGIAGVMSLAFKLKQRASFLHCTQLPKLARNNLGNNGDDLTWLFQESLEVPETVPLSNGNNYEDVETNNDLCQEVLLNSYFDWRIPKFI